MPELLTVAASLPVQCRSAGVFRPREVNRYPSRRLELFELILVRQGVLHLSIEGRRYEVGPNQTLLIQPGMRHRGTRENPLHLVYYWVYFSLSDASVAKPDFEFSVPEFATVQRPDHMLALLNRVLEDKDTGTYGGSTADLSLLLALTEIALEPTTQAGAETYASIAHRADALIRSDFHTPISTAEIADQLGCSANYLGRTYRKTFGISVVDALHRRRIQHAQHLLMMGELDLDDIARHSGFIDIGYFRRIFKRHTGMTPRRYQTLNVRAQWQQEE